MNIACKLGACASLMAWWTEYLRVAVGSPLSKAHGGCTWHVPRVPRVPRCNHLAAQRFGSQYHSIQIPLYLVLLGLCPRK